MSAEFDFDVFLSHSSKDKSVVRALADRLRSDGLRVWLDEWEIHPGDSIPCKIEEGLERSRVLVLCMSANAFGSEWAQLEAGTFRFRDPLNKERRFVPLRLDNSPIKGSLGQFLYINWLPTVRDREYRKLFEACRPPTKASVAQPSQAWAELRENTISLDRSSNVMSVAWSPDGRRALSGSVDRIVRLWDVDSGRCLRPLQGHVGAVLSVAWNPDGRRALSSSADSSVRIWDVDSGRTLSIFGRLGSVPCAAWSPDGRRVLSGSLDRTVCIWDVDSRRCLHVLEGHSDAVYTVAWNPDGRHALSGSADGTVRIWDVDSGRSALVLEGHSRSVHSVTWSPDGRYCLSGARDMTVRLWDVDSGRCLRVFEGHSTGVSSVAWSPDGRHALSGSLDMTIRVWDIKSGRCLHLLESPSDKNSSDRVVCVAWSPDGCRAFAATFRGVIRVWTVANWVREVPLAEAPTPPPTTLEIQAQYMNAKVLLVGDTGSGKTGLSRRLVLNDWKRSDSTFGAWVTHWKLPVSSSVDVEREIWLWDFGGQADQRLIHQLYMDDTAVAVLVFDGQKDNLFETLGQWDRDLARCSRKSFTKLLAAGRVDAGGLRVSRSQVDGFAKERGFSNRLFETSAKFGTDCEELKQAIITAIDWENVPWRSSPLLFKRLKEEILRIKDEGRVLMRFNELRDALRVRLAGEDFEFKDEELKAVIGLLAGPGVVWELEFGSWVLLQPESINAYAQAVIQTLRADDFERGCIPEGMVLGGDLRYQSSLRRLAPAEERFVLLAMHQTLVERGLCLREHTDQGTLLIFPSYYRRERSELVECPAALVSYRFNGFLDDVYTTLVVRLHHTEAFQHDQLWRDAADFKTLTGKQLGVKLTRLAEGMGELELYFDPTIPLEEKIIFSRYVHEHLLQKGQDVVRLRHYVCPHCGTIVGNLEVARRRLDGWLQNCRPEPPTIVCADCEQRVPLWDDLEQCFADDKMRQRVRKLQDQSAIELDNESKERALVGEVISTVALAGQICREFSVSDHGIDMEIEFKDDQNEPTGQKLYLQLKSGDSYLRRRRNDGADIFTMKKKRHARYWMAQAFPVLLVIRTSDDEVRWMEVRDFLKRESNNGEKPVKQIVFEGERFDVMSVRRWRDRIVGTGSP